MTLAVTLVLPPAPTARENVPRAVASQRGWEAGSTEHGVENGSHSLLVVCWVHYGWAMVRATNLSSVCGGHPLHNALAPLTRRWVPDRRLLSQARRERGTHGSFTVASGCWNSARWVSSPNAARCKWAQRVIFGWAEADGDLNEWKWEQGVCFLRGR